LQLDIALLQFCTGYDGIQEFVPAMLELIQSKVTGGRGTGTDKNVVKLEKASAFYLPPICETMKGSHAEPALKEFSEDCLRLTNGSPIDPPLRTDGANYVEPFVARSAGNCFKSYHNNDNSVSNGTA